MTEEPISAEETAALPGGASNQLLIDASLGLLLPGLALILVPDVLLVGEMPITVAVILIAELFLLSVHLGMQESPAYPRLAPLLIGPLALAPVFAGWLALQLPLLVGLLTLVPAAVFVRAAWRAGKHLR